MSETSSKPKPHKRNAQASRKRLIDAAIDVFSRNGPKGATIDEICDTAQLNKRLAYHYFGNKEGLYKEALRTIYQQFFDLEVELGSMLLPVEELLVVLVTNYYAFIDANPNFVKMISYENLNEGRIAQQLDLAGQKASVITALQLALQKGQAEGRFRKDIDPTELLLSVFALCWFCFTNRFTLGLLLDKDIMAPSDLEKRTEHVLELLMHGISVDGK